LLQGMPAPLTICELCEIAACIDCLVHTAKRGFSGRFLSDFPLPCPLVGYGGALTDMVTAREAAREEAEGRDKWFGMKKWFRRGGSCQEGVGEEGVTFSGGLPDKFIVFHGIIKGKGLQFPGTNFVDKTLKPPESAYTTTFLVLSRILHKICTRAWSPFPVIIPWKTMKIPS